MPDFSYLKVGDRICIKWVGLTLRNLLVTEVDEKYLIVEHVYPFSRSTGQPCDNTSDGMLLVRGDEM